jgi:cytochrome c5
VVRHWSRRFATGCEILLTAATWSTRTMPAKCAGGIHGNCEQNATVARVHSTLHQHDGEFAGPSVKSEPA